MSYTPRPLDEMETEAVASCMRGSCKAMTFDTGSRLVFLQSTGHGGEQNPQDPAFKPEVLNNVPVVFPYGHLSLAPAGAKVETELLETAAGVLCVAVRTALPAGIPAPSAGDSVQFSSGGGYAHHDADGDTVIEPPSGQVLMLGSDAKDFVALAALVKTEIKALRDWAAGHQHTETGGTTSVPSVLPSDVGDVKATKVKAR